MKPRKKISKLYMSNLKTKKALWGYKAYARQLILSASEILFVSQQGGIVQMITLRI